MRQTYAWTVAAAIVALSSLTLIAAQDFSNDLCLAPAKTLDFKAVCARRSSIISPNAQSWSFTIAPGATFSVVISVRFVGKHRATVQVKNGATVVNATTHPNTFGEEVFATVKGAGSYTIVLTPYYGNIPVVYLVRATAAAQVPLIAAHVESLTGIYKSCCSGVSSPNCDLLKAPASICSSPPNACSAKGELMWLSLVGGLDCAKGINQNAEISGLTTLNTIDLSYNKIVQEATTLTAELFSDNTPYLIYIYMAHNKLSGQIVDATVALTKEIRVIDFRNNTLADAVPVVLFQQASTEEVLLSHNNMTSAFPGIQAPAKKFAVLDISYNQLSGVGFTMSSPMLYVDVSYNKFFQSMPYPNVTTDLVHYDASNNEFTGEPPESFKQATRLAYVDVSHNKLNGYLTFLLAPRGSPELAPKCTRIAHMKVNDNLLSGYIFFSIANFTNMQTLELQNNKFIGSLAALGADLKPETNVLTTLNTSGNSFEGPLPDSFRNLAALSAENLPDTAEEGFNGVKMVPTERVFDVSNNLNVSGVFPVFVAKAAATLIPGYTARGAPDAVRFLVSGGSNTFDCPKNNSENMQAQDLYAIQNSGYQCYVAKDQVTGLEDALSSVVPGVASPPPPPKSLYPPGPPAEADQNLKIIGICLGVGLFLALLVAGVFAYKWRDLDLKLKSRYHKQGEDFKPSYVVSPRADAAGGADQDPNAPPKKQGFDGVV